MKIGRIQQQGQPVWVTIEDDMVYPLEGRPWDEPRTHGAPIGPLTEASLLAPVRPGKVVAVGLNYASYARETNLSIPAEPLLFFKPPTAVVGAEANIIWPQQSQELDSAAELAVVISRRAKNVSLLHAHDYILGYTCTNDITARDFQRRDGQWARAKGFDTFCPLGPWIETDFDPDEGHLTCRINGEVRQNSPLSDMVFGVEYLVHYISAYFTLEPGDVIGTGTPAGVGAVEAGDVVEVAIEGIGTLRNQVVRPG